MESRGVSEDNQVYYDPPSSSNEVANTASATSSRIPSHVFAPTSTNSVAEWSVTSNESLLSIHIGNMSFNDKSGELDPSSPLFEYPVNNLSTSIVNSTGSDDEDGDGSVNEEAIKTMRQVLGEKESQKKNDIHDKEPNNLGRSMSQLSDTSSKSFAFPILTAEASKRGTKNKKQASSQHSTTTTTPPPETPKPLRVPETTEAETPKATQNGSPKRWFFCFSCLPF